MASSITELTEEEIVLFEEFIDMSEEEEYLLGEIRFLKRCLAALGERLDVVSEFLVNNGGGDGS